MAQCFYYKNYTSLSQVQAETPPNAFTPSPFHLKPTSPPTPTRPRKHPSLVPRPRRINLTLNIIPPKPLLENRILPLIRVPLKRIPIILNQLSIPFLLSRSIVHMEDMSRVRGLLDDARGARFADRFVDGEDVGESEA